MTAISPNAGSARTTASGGFEAFKGSLVGRDLVILLVGVVLAAGAALSLRVSAEAQERVRFERRAREVAAAMERALEPPTEALFSLAALFEAREAPDRREFDAFALALLRRNPAAYAFEWAPRVDDARREPFERAARREMGPLFSPWERGEGGKHRPARRGAPIFPVLYMQPPNEAFLGYDLGPGSSRWETAEKAIAQRRPAATRRFRLIEEPDVSKQDAVAIYEAVMETRVQRRTPAERIRDTRGLALVVFRAPPLLEAATAALDLDGLRLAVRDDGGETVWERPGPSGGLRSASFVVPFADRGWSVEVTALPGAFHPSTQLPLATLAAGSLATLLFWLAVVRTRTIRRLRRQRDAASHLGPYAITRKLGQGAMGVVYQASHELLAREAAVKLLAPNEIGAAAMARFEREVRITASLHHPNTVLVYDFGRTPDDGFYCAMELIDGVDLTQLVRYDGPQAPGRVVNVLRQACGSLVEAHDAGLVHRDIKPSNLMIGVRGGIPDFVKVLDFGIARAPAEAGPDPDTGYVLGTPLYLAPEAWVEGEAFDRRLDLYGLAATAYFLLAGTPPFRGHSPTEIRRAQLSGPPVPPSERSDVPVPVSLEKVLLACLEPDPANRPASARELSSLLAACGGVRAWTRRDAETWWSERGASIRHRVLEDAIRAPEAAADATLVLTGGTIPAAGRRRRPDSTSSERRPG